MFNPTNVIRGGLVVQNIPENACFTSFVELLKALPTYLGVQIPDSVTNVIVSNIQPTSGDTTKVWFRLNNAGSFVGIYVFSQGEWRNIYPINDGNQFTIQTFVSLDGSVPSGWKKIETGDPDLPVAVVSSFVAENVLDPSSTFAQRFAAYFIGF